MRLRFFADFAKLERLAVRPQHRRSSITFAIVREALRIVARKDFHRTYAHVRVGLKPFWARFGAKPVGAVAFSGERYTEMAVDLGSDPAAIRWSAKAELVNRPDGDWDPPGPLERQ